MRGAFGLAPSWIAALLQSPVTATLISTAARIRPLGWSIVAATNTVKFDGRWRTMETKPDDSGLPVSGVGKIGVAGDGKHIYFEFLFPSGHRDRFNLSFSDMDAVVLGLQGALVGVAKKYAGQTEVSSLRGARPELLVNFTLDLQRARDCRRS